MRNNNTAVIRRLTRRTLQVNKKRNFFIVMAVMLTTFLLGSVFGMGMSILESMEMQRLRLVGTVAHGAVGFPTKAQLEKLRTLPYVRSVGVTIPNVATVVQSQPTEEGSVQMGWFDRDNWEQRLPTYVDVVGHYPEQEDEIIASRATLKSLGIDEPALGMELTLSYRIMEDVPGETPGEMLQKTFRLSGWYTDFAQVYGRGEGGSWMIVSEQFARSCGKTLEKDGGAEVAFDDPARAEEYFERLKTDLSLTETQPIVKAGDLELGMSTRLTTGLSMVVIAVFLVLTGYLLIANVLQMSVSRDARFYGLLKTLGTTPRQIRRIVTGQILRLCLVGIPIGAGLAFLFSAVVVPVIIDSLKMVSTGAVLSVSPLIYLGAAAFALLTALLSAFRPAAKAAAVSPVEAQKAPGVVLKLGQVRKPAGGKPYRMALRGMFRDKKSAALVLGSLFLGITTFLAVSTVLSCMGGEQYMAALYPNDFRLEHEGYLDEVRVQEFDDALLAQLEALPGLEGIEVRKKERVRLDYSPEEFGDYAANWIKNATYDDARKMTEEDIRANFVSYLVGMDSESLRKLAVKGGQSIDFDAYDRGEIALLAGGDPALFTKVSELRLTPERLSKQSIPGDEANWEQLTLPLGGVVAESVQTTSGMAPTVLVSKSLLEKLYTAPTVSEVCLDFAPDDELRAKAAIEQLTGGKPNIGFTSKAEAVEQMQGYLAITSVLGNGLAFVVALIGVLNFVNVTSTGVLVRKRELAVLEGVGMEKRKIRQMLLLEGLGYAVLTLLLTATLGTAVICGVFELMRQNLDNVLFVYPVIPFLIVALTVLVICAVAPMVAYRSANQTTLSERLREAE